MTKTGANVCLVVQSRQSTVIGDNSSVEEMAVCHEGLHPLVKGTEHNDK